MGPASHRVSLAERRHPVVNVMDDAELTRFMQGIKSGIENTVARLPDHQVYVEQYCKAMS